MAKGDGNKAEYEESRARRIKENAERMKSLGLFDLSRNLIKASKPKPKLMPASTPSDEPPRRSSRLKELPQVSFMEKGYFIRTKNNWNGEIHIKEGKNPEIYTEEDEELLGDSKAVWEPFVDDGMYDSVDDTKCHQCRKKTLGLYTECCKCKLVAQRFCGVCLNKRYGENIKEAKENPDWVCPMCRGICNCSRCRRKKGWMPTGSIYNRVVNLGFKSVAHYLIYTKRGQAIAVESFPTNERKREGEKR